MRAISLLIVLLALALRLWRLDLVPFESDHAVLMHLAEDAVVQGRLPLGGPLSSVGLSTAPHFIYLIAPVVAVSRDPIVVSAFLAILNTAAVAGTLWLGWRMFGPLAGNVTGLLFAVQPIAVAYSRPVWQPDLVMPLAVLFLIALDLGVVCRRAGWAAASFPIATLLTLVHVSSVALVSLLVAPAVVLGRRHRWLPLTAGLGVAALLTTPFIALEFTKNWIDYPNYRFYSSLHTFVDLDSVEAFLAAATLWHVPDDGVVPIAASVAWLPGTAAVLEVGALALGVVLALAGLGRFVWRPPAATRLRLAGLLAWLVLPVAFSIRHWQGLFPHYFFATLPAAFLLMSVPFVRFGGSWSRLIRPVAGCLVAGIVALQLTWIVDGVRSATDADWMPCLAQSLSSAVSTERELALLGKRDGARRAAAELDSADSRPMTYLLRSDFPDVELAPPERTSQVPSLYGEVGLGAQARPLLSVGAIDAPNVLGSSREPGLTSANGFSLLDVAVSGQPRPDQTVDVALTWAVDEGATSITPYSWDLAVQDANGREVVSELGLDHIPANLAGERVVSWFSIDARKRIAPGELQPGPYRLDISLVDRFANNERVDLIERNGDASESYSLPVQIGPLSRCPV